MIGLSELYTRDHDDMAGYGGRIGYRYKTSLTVFIKAKDWSAFKKKGDIGSFALDVKNLVYKQYGFKQTYSPQIDTKARAKKGVVDIAVDFFHNSDEDAIIGGYDVERGMLRHHKRAAEKQGIKYNPSQWELDPNNE